MLEQIVRRCLEKNPQERYQSIQDVAFILESVSVAGPVSQTHAPMAGKKRSLWPLVTTACVLAAFGLGVMLARMLWKVEPLRYFPFPVRQGPMFVARFAPDGQSRGCSRFQSNASRSPR